MPDDLEFTVLTPSGPIVDRVVTSKVRVRLVDGLLLSIYPGHAPILGETMAGDVLYVAQEQRKTLDLQSGIFHVVENRITIYTTGKVGEACEQEQMPGVSGEDRAERFDRLTETLMTELGADPGGISGLDSGDSRA